jgi:hypothetical protein
MDKKIKVTIDRSKWRTGADSIYSTGNGATCLLNSQGFMCCLGFCSKALGIEDAVMLNKNYPSNIYCKVLENSKLVFNAAYEKFDTNLTSAAVVINDFSFSSPETKEEELLELFNDSVFELEFIGEYTKEKND